MSTSRKLLGDSGESDRVLGDFYPTPPYATKALLDHENFSGNIWEPCCGDGAISKMLKGFDVYSSDIIDRGYGDSGVDFLNENGMFQKPHLVHDNIITNPPFNKALDFVLMSKKYARFKIAMFLKTTFLEGVNRYEMFRDKKFPLKTVYQFVRRVSFNENASGGMLSFAWFVWERDYMGDPFIKWINK